MVLPVGTVTFLFTDIEGSTKLWEQSPEQMRVALARHDELLRDAIQSRQGVVFKTIGDAFCAAFATATDAVQSALTIERALASEPWEGGLTLRVRIALHTGVAELRNGDYFGQTLNRIARLLAIAHGGQVLLSDAVQKLLGEALPPGVSLRDMGSQRLKDLQQPEHVWQMLHADLAADFPPLRSLAPTSTNLPVQTTAFIGRERELSEVKRLLASAPILTLTGSGGVGKSRLMLQAAAEVAHEFEDGVWLVELAPLTDPALVPQALATALHVREESGRTLTATLVEALKSKALLLLLDNCEHLLDACAQAADGLLRSCPNVKILATSRERLRIGGERTYRVSSLSLPDLANLPPPEALERWEAIRFFSERARSHQPGFTVTDRNATALAQVCHRLDGVPLALELAAARTRAMPVEQIAERLDDRFRLLTGGSRTALPRQQTLRALVDWSYDLLTPSERLLFHRLSVFVGGWTLEATEAVCADESMEAWEMLDLLTSLVDKSLVHYEETEGGPARYRLLETLRQYARGRLEETKETNAVQRQHATYYAQLAQTARSQLESASQQEWLDRLDKEMDNLRAALGYFIDQEAGRSEGMQMAADLQVFWDVRGYLSEGRDWLQKALDSTEGATRARGNALNSLGVLARELGDYALSRRSHEESLSICRQLGNQRSVVSSLCNLGVLFYDQGDYAEAFRLFTEAYQISREEGDEHRAATLLSNLGVLARELGDLPKARALYEESLTLLREKGGSQQVIANTISNLGSVAQDQKDYAAARALYEESLNIRRSLADVMGIAISLINLGLVTKDQNAFTESEAHLKEAITLLRDSGNRRLLAYAFEALAALRFRQQEATQAARIWGAAAELRHSLGSPLPPNEREEYETLVEACRNTLGEKDFMTAWEEGARRPLETTLDMALEEAAP